MNIIKIYKENINESLLAEIIRFLGKTPKKEIDATRIQNEIVSVLVDDTVCGASFVLRTTKINDKKYFVLGIYVLPECRKRILTQKNSLLDSSFDILKNEKDYNGILLEVINLNVTENILDSFGYKKIGQTLNFVKHFNE